MLGLALERSGIPATVLDAESAGLLCTGDAFEADPVAVDEGALHAALDERSVLVLPGFFARTEAGHVALLGRGGSDLTALFVAARLGSTCRLVKDVDGLYERDPNSPGPAPRRYSRVHWSDALALEGGIVQHKAVRFAMQRELAFEVAALGSPTETLVGPHSSAFGEPCVAERPLRVALLGLGTVGGGVCCALRALPERFEIVSALVRRSWPGRDLPLPAAVVTDHLDDVFATPHDVLVELVGGVDTAAAAVRTALARGRDVVSANKALLARDGDCLRRLAERTGATLSFSSAVGGALPALEVVESLARRTRIEGFEGVLNGTTNFVLHELSSGASFAAAVERARTLGLAESDPRRDLDGTDCVDKVRLLAAAAFPDAGEVRWLEREGILSLDGGARSRPGHVPRLVATCMRSATGPVASVSLRHLPLHDPLARVEGAQNMLAVSLADGSTVRRVAMGAGRWPTTESVVGDLLALHRSRATRPQPASAAC